MSAGWDLVIWLETSTAGEQGQPDQVADFPLPRPQVTCAPY